MQDIDQMDKTNYDHFLALSAVLTGFNHVELQGTGLAPEYFKLINSIVGEEVCNELWSNAFRIIAMEAENENTCYGLIRNELLSNLKFGPVVRNIIKLWYLGQWEALPASWREVYGNNPGDVNRIISPSAYKEGLVWVAIGAHPMGAKPSGFGTWGNPPKQTNKDV